MCLLQEKKCCLILLIRTMQCRSNYLDHLTGDFEGSVEERMAYFLQKAQGFSDFLSFFFSFTLFYFTILYWFCHTSTWIRHGCTCVPHPEPPLPPPSAYHPSGSSQCTSSKHLVSCIEPRLAIRFLYDIYMFQCRYPKSSHPLPLP